MNISVKNIDSVLIKDLKLSYFRALIVCRWCGLGCVKFKVNMKMDFIVYWSALNYISKVLRWGSLPGLPDKFNLFLRRLLFKYIFKCLKIKNIHDFWLLKDSVHTLPFRKWCKWYQRDPCKFHGIRINRHGTRFLRSEKKKSSVLAFSCIK